MRTLNRQRASLVLSTLLDGGAPLSPEQVSTRERILERDGVLRWKGSCNVLGYAQIGVTLRALLAVLGPPQASTGSVQTSETTLAELEKIHQNEDHLLWYDRRRRMILIILKERATAISQLKAWGHGLLVAQRMSLQSPWSAKSGSERRWNSIIRNSIRDALADVQPCFAEEGVQDLKGAGWDLDTAALMTQPGFRISQGDP